MAEATLHAIDIDLAANTLLLVVREPGEAAPVERSPAEATIDIGTAGRLIGVEGGDLYLDVMPPESGTEHLIRSVTARVTVEREAASGSLLAIVVPRAGEGYEITYPSGNQ